MLMCNIMNAQKTINGIVINNQSNEPVFGAQIQDQTGDHYTETDEEGKFTMQTNSDSIYVGYYGMETQLYSVNETVFKLETSFVIIDEVIVSNARGAQKRSEAPVAISTVNNQQIEENKPTSINEVLNQSSGVLMVDLGSEQHSMSIRQPMSYGASYLYMEDGVPIRTSGVFNHNALLEINMAHVSAIEIVRGPASSIYGSEAIGGAVNFITKKPSIALTAGASFRADNLGYKRSDFYVSNSYKKFGFRFSGYYGIRQDGLMEHSDFSKLGLSLSANYFINEKSNLSFTNSYVDYYADMRGSLDSTRFFEKEYASNQTFTNRDVLSYRSKLQYNLITGRNSKFSATMYYRNNSIKQTPSYRVKDDFVPWTGQGNPNLAHGEQNDNSFNSYGMVLQQKQQVGENFSFLVGASIDYSPNQYFAEYISIGKSADVLYDSFDKTDSLLADYQTNLLNVGGYFQGKYSILENLHLTLGARYDHFVYDYDNNLDSNAFSGVSDSQNKFGRFTPKVGLNYNHGNQGMYLNIGQGYVPPQVSQLYRGVKVPSIDAAYYNNYEVGGWISLLKGKARVEASLYQMDGIGEIVTVQLNDGSWESRNAGSTQHKGVEFAIYYQPIKDLSIRVNGTYASHLFVDYNDEGNDYSGNDMALAPRFYYNGQITYKPRFAKGLRLSIETQFIDEYFMDNQNSKIYAGYQIFNGRIGYEWKWVEVWTNVMNITNELYANTASSSKWGESYNTGSPRSFMMGVAFKLDQSDKKK